MNHVIHMKKAIKVKVTYTNPSNPSFEFEVDENDTVIRENLGGEFSIDINQITSLLGHVNGIKHWLETYNGIKLEIEEK